MNILIRKKGVYIVQYFGHSTPNGRNSKLIGKFGCNEKVMLSFRVESYFHLEQGHKCFKRKADIAKD